MLEKKLEIAASFEEAKTAKEPGRPIFNDMLKRMESGEAAAKASPAPLVAGLDERTLSSTKNEFVSSFLAPYT